jgi:hypothetical protein
MVTYGFWNSFQGLWLGMGCGLVIQNVALICIILCPNWDQLV